MQPKNKKLFQDETGSGLILALMVLVVLSVLGLSLGVVTVGSYRLGHINQDSSSAYYIAEAGANMAYEEIKGEVEKLATNPEQKGGVFFGKVEEKTKQWNFKYQGDSFFETQSGESPFAEVKLINENVLNKDENLYSKEYVIQSTGNMAGKERTVSKPFEVTWTEEEKKISDGNSLGLPKDAAIIVKESATFKNKSIVKDKIIGDNNIQIKNDSESIPTIEKTELNWDLYREALNNQPKMTTYKPSGAWTIETNGETKNYRVESFDFKNDSISILGGGTVNIFLNSPFSNNNFSNKNKITNIVDGQLNLIYSGSAKFVIGNGVTGEFVLFAPNASVVLENGSVIHGSVISKNIELNNSSQILFPKGLVYEFPFGSINESDTEEVPYEIELITDNPAIEQ